MNDDPDGRAGQPNMPLDVDAEAAVLSALLGTPEVFVDVVDELTPDDFSHPKLSMVYEAVLRCDAAAQPWDDVTLFDQLRKMGVLETSGGKDTLARLRARQPDAEHVTAHVRIVADRALLRRTVTAGRSIVSSASHGTADAQIVLAEAERQVFALGTRTQSGFVPMASSVATMQQQMAQARQREMLGLSTGFAELDRVTSGFQAGQLIVVGGRPGSGKSALMVTNFARHIAETTGQMVPVLSFEMSAPEISFRLLASAIRHPLTELRAGRLPGSTQAERDVGVESARLAQLPMVIDDTPPPTVVGVRSSLRRLARRGPIAAVVIDYLQLMSGSRGDGNRVSEIGEISRGLKQLASELEVPVIVGSQLSRQSVAAGPAQRPSLHHLRESGSIENDASLVLLTHRPHAAGEVSVPPSVATLIVAKQRNGPAGVDIPLDFEPQWASFTSSDRTPTPPGGRTDVGF